MVCTQSVILVGASLALFASPASAQARGNKLFRRASAPRQATLDLSTGTYTRGPVIRDRGTATVTELWNLDGLDGSGFGWVTVDTGNGACTWFSNAALGRPHTRWFQGSDLMSGVLFLYCSGALDVNSGGAGGNVEIGFYEGYTLFGGAPTTTATVVNLTGMPANDAPGGFFGGDRCYGLNVVFNPMVAFSDNAFIGYSWRFMDLGTDGLYGATYPFLACIVSCSGTSLLNGSAGGIGLATGLAEDGQGMLDAFDAFCTGAYPNGPTANTYTFATSGPFAPPFAPTTRASIAMEIRMQPVASRPTRQR